MSIFIRDFRARLFAYTGHISSINYSFVRRRKSKSLKENDSSVPTWHGMFASFFNFRTSDKDGARCR